MAPSRRRSPPAEQTSLPPIRLRVGTWLQVTVLNALRRTEGRVGRGRKWPEEVSFQPDVPARPDPLPRPCCSPLPLAVLGRSRSSWRSAGSIPALHHGVFGVGSLWPTVAAVSSVGGSRPLSASLHIAESKAVRCGHSRRGDTHRHVSLQRVLQKEVSCNAHQLCFVISGSGR